MRPIIQVDNRAGSGEYVSWFNPAKVDARLCSLEFADFAFTGHGPGGRPLSVGYERKTISDLLSSTDGDNRLYSRQLPGMVGAYGLPILLVEGSPYPDQERRVSGILFHLMSYGIPIVRTAAAKGTIEHIQNHALWLSRNWSSHSMSHVSIPKVTIARGFDLSGARSLMASVFAQIPGIGADKALALASSFPTMRAAMAASKSDFAEVKGIGPTLAKQLEDVFQNG